MDNWDSSDVDLDPHADEILRSVSFARKLALKEGAYPEGTVFTIIENPGLTFISQEMAAAIRAAGLRGVELTPLPDLRLGPG